MPRPLESALEYCLDRENPRVETYAEISAPDASRVLRRHTDQLLQAPDPLVSLTPASSLVSAPSGGVAIASTPTTLLSFFSAAVNPMNVDQEDSTKRLKGVLWAVDPAFERALLRSFTARLTRVGLFTAALPGFELQIYRATGRQGVLTKSDGTKRAFFQWDFVPLLASPVAVLPRNVAWSGTTADVVFDLTGQNLYVDGARGQLPSSQFNGQTNYYFSVRQTTTIPGGVQWSADNVSARTIAGIGSFDQSWWTRTNPSDAWAQQLFGQVPRCSIQIEQYAPAGGQAQAVYKIEQRDALGTLRAPSAGTTGRVVVAGAVPNGTTLLTELSTAGSGGPWTAVKDGDVVAIAQQLYHMRATLTPSASQRMTPILAAIGVEFRTPIDVSREMIVAPLSRDINVPFGAATVGDGSLRVLRTGRRDYRDAATSLGSTQPATKLEADIWLRSSHPNVTRDKWLRLDRAAIVDRAPDELGETFQLLSFLTMLQRDVPLPVESINSVHTVQGSPTPTALAFVVSPNLPGATVGGSEYTGKNYYLRVRSSSVSGLAPGTVALIASQTNANQINVNAGDLPAAPVAGDVIEVHSGTLNAPVLSYKDWDPAAVWFDLLVNQLQIPEARIGLGHLPRGGKPPAVTDRAPGDATTQAKYKVSLALDKAERGDKLVDQVSFLMGGATVEIAGQLCFVQLYPLRDGTGTISVPLPASSRTFDPRDYFSEKFPQGLAQQQAAVKCGYGVDLTVPEALRGPAAQTEVADSDAINWLTLSPTDNRGRTEIPAEIARWCFNSADAGLLLATEAAHQVVAYCATGLRPWEWNTRDAWPQHHAGDVVTVITDQYTDYDPSGLVAISGWMAFNVVLLGVSADGRRFRGLVPGINRNAARRVGGQPGIADSGRIGVACPAIIVAHKVSNTVFAPTPVLLVSFTAPADHNYDGLELQVKMDGDATTIANVAKTTTSPIRVPAVWDTVYVVTPTCVAKNGVRTVGTPVSYTVPQGNKLKRDIPLMKADGSGASDGYMAAGDSSDPTGGTLPSGQQIKDGSQSRNMLRGYQSGFAADGDIITFAPVYSVIPLSRVTRGPGALIAQPDATKWSAGYSAAVAVREDFRFTSLSASGGAINGKLRQKATPTPQNTDFPNTTLVAGGTSETLVAASAPSQSGTYTIRYKYSVTATTGTPGNARQAILVVRVCQRAGGPTGTQTVLDTRLFTVTDTSGSGTTNSAVINVSVSATMTASDYFEIELNTLSFSGNATGSQSATVRGGVHTDAAPANVYGLSFTTAASADPTATATPDAGDLMFWEVWLP